MTIAETYSKIVELTAASSGIGLCQEELLRSLPLDGFPVAVVKVGPATWNEHASGLYRQVRQYTIEVYVKLAAEGVEPDEGYKECLPPLYALGRTFVTNTTLDGTVDGLGPQTDGTFEDSGVRVLEYAGTGTPYHGFTVTLLVTEKAS